MAGRVALCWSLLIPQLVGSYRGEFEGFVDSCIRGLFVWLISTADQTGLKMLSNEWKDWFRSGDFCSFSLAETIDPRASVAVQRWRRTTRGFNSHRNSLEPASFSSLHWRLSRVRLRFRYRARTCLFEWHSKLVLQILFAGLFTLRAWIKSNLFSRRAHLAKLSESSHYLNWTGLTTTMCAAWFH